MITGIGTDIAECDRFRKAWERFGARFAARILTPSETAALPEGDAAAYLASRFAVKEAAVKALGTGFSGGIAPHEIGIEKDALGRPSLVFSGKALEAFKRSGSARSHVSYSHEKDYACATVILES